MVLALRQNLLNLRHALSGFGVLRAEILGSGCRPLRCGRAIGLKAERWL